MAEKQKYACNPEIWVDQFSDELFRFAVYRVKNREVAEDLVQDTFLSGLTEANGVVLLFLGLGTRLISIPLIVVILAAIFTVHFANGFKAGNNGFEIPLYYILMLFTLIVFGSGKFSDDYLIRKKK